MVDRDDDILAGVKSTAILFGRHDRLIVAILQLLCLMTLYLAGLAFELGSYYMLSLGVSAALFGYQQYLIRGRERDACFRAFLHNNWVGMAIFAGIVLHYGS
jgi:4-hydroxybenzoate polyprenyltransferase